MFFLFRPIITLNWSQIVLHSNNVFEFVTIEPLRKHQNENNEHLNHSIQQKILVQLNFLVFNI